MSFPIVFIYYLGRGLELYTAFFFEFSNLKKIKYNFFLMLLDFAFFLDFAYF